MTLQDRLNGRIEIGRRCGPLPVLTSQEENQFADWLIELANRGFGVSKDSLFQAVKKFLDKDGRATPFKNNKPGSKWFRGFVKRNPKVKVRKARPLEKKRAKISKDDVDAWFDDFQEFLVAKNLANKPSKSGIVTRLVLTCKAELGISLAGLTGNKLRIVSFQEAENISPCYLVLMPAASGCLLILFSLVSAFQ